MTYQGGKVGIALWNGMLRNRARAARSRGTAVGRALLCWTRLACLPAVLVSFHRLSVPLAPEASILPLAAVVAITL